MGRIAGHLETGLQLFSGGSQGRKALKLLLKASGAESENAHEAAAQVVRADCMEAVSACREQESLVHLLIAAGRQRPSHGSGLQQAPAAPAGQAGGLDLDAAFAASDIRWIGVIGQPLDQAAIAPLLQGAPKPVVWIQGERRARNRLNAVWRRFPAMLSMCSFMTEPAVWLSPRVNRCARAVQEGGAVIAATPVTDTIKRVDAQGVIADTPTARSSGPRRRRRGLLWRPCARVMTKPRPVDGASLTTLPCLSDWGGMCAFSMRGPPTSRSPRRLISRWRRPCSVSVEMASSHSGSPDPRPTAPPHPLAGLHCHRFRGRPADRQSPGS